MYCIFHGFQMSDVYNTLQLLMKIGTCCNRMAVGVPLHFGKKVQKTILNVKKIRLCEQVVFAFEYRIEF